ncbi:hypothetical protein RBSWK_01864 [Rhodopirellula baltica SWK14]|uniref:Uncharacterized protein n=1 Tax=Rhodopirellula baltica SWK14 TaxID=993516 RepID=L7CKY2_RHOBT|nr:hypothetical protein RBSWK_01864 [Rhodopirellula baltica SWK14]
MTALSTSADFADTVSHHLDRSEICCSELLQSSAVPAFTLLGTLT